MKWFRSLLLTLLAVSCISVALFLRGWGGSSGDRNIVINTKTLVETADQEAMGSMRDRMIDLNKRQRIVIIGAGPTALGVVHRLYELGIMRSNAQIIGLEKESKAGGSAVSERDENGFLWDMGGHVTFSHYKYFTEVLDRAIPEWNEHVRAAYAFMKGSDGVRRFLPYPVQDNIHVMDDIDQQKSLAGLEELKPSHEEPANFDEWLLKHFGEGLCDVFMRKYNQKIWTVHPKEMNAVWVGAAVAVPDVNKIKDKIAASKKGEEAKDSEWGFNHLFRFPRYGGTGAIWTAIADNLPQGLFHYGLNVVGVNVRDKTVQIKSTSGEKQDLKYDHLISTTPLDALLNLVEDGDATSLQMKSLAKEFVYTRTHIVGIGLKGQPPSFLEKKSWMYFPDSDSPFYRITVFSSYSDDHVPEPGKQWSLMCEAAEPKAGNSWTKEVLLNKTIAALIDYGFIIADQVVSKYYRYLEHGYPVPTLGRDKLLTILQPWLQSNGIYARGRFGGWLYEVSSQDHSFMQGVEMADLLVRGIPEETYPDPVRVNTMRASNRALRSPLPETAPDTEFVISHYNENLDWLKPLADNSHIYTKSSDSNMPQFQFRQWEKLRNVGRESYVYLYHIIRNYNHLSNVTVFNQAEVHGQFCFHNLSDYVPVARKGRFFCVFQNENGRSAEGPGAIFNNWNRIDHIRKWKNDQTHGLMRNTSVTIAQFWQSIFGYPHPESVYRCYSGCFSVTREQIRKRPIEFYKRILPFIDDHSNPEEGHYLERLWFAIFMHNA